MYVIGCLPTPGPRTAVLGALGPVNVTAHMLTITEHKVTPQLLAPALKGRRNRTVALQGAGQGPVIVRLGGGVLRGGRGAVLLVQVPWARGGCQLFGRRRIEEELAHMRMGGSTG